MTKKGSGEILVAHDGSASALAAAHVAIQVARSQNLFVYGLYVVDEVLALDTYADYRSELAGNREPESRSELLAWFEVQGDAALHGLEVRCQAAGVPVTTELVAGGVPEMVLRASEQAGLLAIGRRGRGHEADPGYLGQSFRAIAHRIAVPLIAGGGEERTVRRLLVAYDGSKRAHSALHWAATLQRSLKAEVVALAVQEDEVQPTGEWLEEARVQLPGCQCLRRAGQPASEIVAAAGETQADLIVLGRYRHAALLEWFMGSTVDRVLHETELPVLVA